MEIGESIQIFVPTLYKRMNDFLDIWKELTSFLFQFLEEKLFNADNSIVCFFSLVNHCLHCYKFTTNKIIFATGV